MVSLLSMHKRLEGEWFYIDAAESESCRTCIVVGSLIMDKLRACG